MIDLFCLFLVESSVSVFLDFSLSFLSFLFSVRGNASSAGWRRTGIFFFYFSRGRVASLLCLNITLLPPGGLISGGPEITTYLPREVGWLSESSSCVFIIVDAMGY